ncbi:MAG: ribonuclease Z [Planctomycetes bacterium]|nr:ribonuclease Z [Planctomycetota bacterium]HON45819.1 ribonuclease Z [Planctomycetota bacterium]HPY74548.1 ribonuclease Z [Planctomycetota bacterium]HQB00192.1 ribonuclease Z [Planctomycetota bacterium]HRU51081.1 ribonuclease Z [Planctomycetota bacterium]
MDKKVKILFIGTGDFSNLQGRANQAIWIEYGETKFLVDCGPTTLYRMQLMNLNPNELSGIVLTHFHGDHTLGIVQVDLALTLNWERKKSFFYAGPKGISSYFSNLYHVAYCDFFPNFQFERVFWEYEPCKSYPIQDVIVTTFPMLHKKESLGYRFQMGEKIIAITGDTSWNDNIIPLAKNTDLFISECVSYKVGENPHHLCYQTLKEKYECLSTKRIILTHLGQSLIEKINELDFSVAEDGMEIIL